MEATIQKWGNSQGVRLPKFILEAVNWKEGERINIKTEKDRIVIEKIEPQKKTIEELFAGYDGDYTPEVIEWGAPLNLARKLESSGLQA